MDALLFDLSDRTQIEITGRDRVKFLHSFCTNDIKKLQPGQGCEAFVTNVNGRFKTGQHYFLNSSNETVPSHLAKEISRLYLKPLNMNKS